MNTRTIDITIRIQVDGKLDGHCRVDGPDPRTAGQIAKDYWLNGLGHGTSSAEVIEIKELKAKQWSAAAVRAHDKKRAAVHEIWPKDD
jgi:hypothetical protein